MFNRLFTFDNQLVYLTVDADAALDAPLAHLFEIVDAVRRPALEEQLVDGHLSGVLADLVHHLIADHEHEPGRRFLLPGNQLPLDVSQSGDSASHYVNNIVLILFRLLHELEIQ